MQHRTFAAGCLASLMLFTSVHPLSAVTLWPRNPLFPDTPQQGVPTFSWKGKKVAFLGDSISDKRHIGTTKCYWEYLEEWLELVPFVYAINGNQMNGVLKQAQRLVEEQGDDVDAIIIFAGTNDYNAGVPLGDWFIYEQKETQVKGGGREVRTHRIPVLSDETFRGRINMALDFLKNRYPTKQIILMTPIHRAKAIFGNQNVQPEELYANKIGEFLDGYVTALKEAGNVWAVPVVDLNSLCGLYPLSDPYVRYFHDADTDRLHPSAEGHERMAKAIYPQLLTLPPTF